MNTGQLLPIDVAGYRLPVAGGAGPATSNRQPATSRAGAVRGFTLVEILVGLLILTFIVTTSLMIVFERERRLLFASETIAVYQALANEAELIRHVPYEQLLAGESDQFSADPVILQGLPDVEKQIHIAESEPGVKNVTLKVRWRNDQRTASLTVVRCATGGDNLW